MNRMKLQIILTGHSVEWHIDNGKLYAVDTYSLADGSLRNELVCVDGWGMRKLLNWLGY